MGRRSTAARIALLIVVAVVGVVVAAIAFVASWDDSRRSTDTTADEIGNTLDLVDAPRWPLRWAANDTVVFQTWIGTATASLDGGVVVKRDPEYLPGADPGPQYDLKRVPSDGRYGRWRAREGGVYLYADGSFIDHKCGPPLLFSPDGSFVACTHHISHPYGKGNESYGAIIRIG